MRVFVLVLATLCLAPGLSAQGSAATDPRYVPPAPVLELRTVLPVQEDPEFQLGPGISVRAGWYLRAALAVLGGVSQRDSTTVGVARVEAALRFHLDPFFEGSGCFRRDGQGRCRGLYAGGGLTQRVYGSGIGAQDPALLFLVGVEGRRRDSGVWALELGVGGGVRIGATWRAKRADGYR